MGILGVCLLAAGLNAVSGTALLIRREA